MVLMVKEFFGYDDSLDAFGVHGAGGTIGALLTGLFATSSSTRLRQGRGRHPLPPAPSTALGPVAQPARRRRHCLGHLHRRHAGAALRRRQVIGLRVSPEDEAAGLDLSQHNEEGYDFNS
jgi:ammonium transporter, Amt family